MSHDADRPDPDQLLSAVQKSEEKALKGKLKIFLGMSAGVGKTYAMLRAAHKLVGEGHRVLVGVVETHGRAETVALLEGLDILPRRRLVYKAAALEEMDLDAILARRPEYVLVDELAHTNVPGSRHLKRYQDVIELLDNGIHVLTALNVQHVESRSDVVRSITGTAIHETVPDSILELAGEVELVDVSPDQLLKRLSEGKVYTGDRAERASENFFRKGNLMALREIALRLTAERVDHDLRDYMRERSIPGPWKSGDRLMVAVGASPTSEKLIRWTRRAAYNLEAPWIAVYVETSRDLSPEDLKTLNQNLALAKELGAEIVATSDVDITRALIRVARQRNVTQIVVGKPVEGYFKKFFAEASPVNRLIRESGEIDVYVVNGGRGKRLQLSKLVRDNLNSTPRQYAIALAFVLCTTALNYLIDPLVGYWTLGLVGLVVIVIQSLFTGRGPILLSAFLSAMLWDFLFIPPRYTFFVTRVEDLMLLLVYVVAALVTGTLATRIRSREMAFATRERRAVSLVEFSRELAQATTVDKVIASTVDLISRVFEADVAIFLRQSDRSVAKVPHPSSNWTPSEKQMSVAVWAYENRQAAGWSTNTLTEAEALHLPLLVPNGVAGVLSYRPKHPAMITIEQKSMLEALTNFAAIFIERELLLASAAETQVLEESERLHKLLLNSISHELRTPIAAIKGATSSLIDPAIASTPLAARALIDEISLANERLNRLVANLLDISRLESGHLKPRPEWCDLADLISVTVNSLRESFRERKVTVELPAKLPLVYGDFVLLEQALRNLIHNALFHTAPGVEVTVTAGRVAERVFVRVDDRGTGIPAAALPHLYDKFFRAPEAKAGGTGLGLAIARGFIEAQGGQLEAANRPDGGASFTLWLPFKVAPQMPREPSA